MTKNDEKRIVKIAEREIEVFAKEWQKSPYLWESETDVHAELYIKIKASLRKKFPLRPYKYEGMAKEELFNWIYCKPKTYIGTKFTLPDLVIYKDAGEKCNVSNKENEPMLWVCEIKYITDWSGLFPKEEIEKDINKLKCLLNSEKNGSDYACCLILRRNIPLSKTVEKVLRGRDRRIHLYQYDIKK